jgi:hypothetical protein
MNQRVLDPSSSIYQVEPTLKALLLGIQQRLSECELAAFHKAQDNKISPLAHCASGVIVCLPALKLLVREVAKGY